LTHFISSYGVWLVAVFIALESVGLPLPGEAALIAAGIFAARNTELDIWVLIVAASLAAILGNTIGFRIGRTFGALLLGRYGARVGLTKDRVLIGQWLFVRYGMAFVFVARFLPFLRNMAAVLAGMNSMAPHRFHVASAAAAVAWVTGYGWASYRLGEAFTNRAVPAAILLGVAALLVLLGVPWLILKYEKRVLAAIKNPPQGSRGPTT
jgi:membrane protein DedA with SNARE-associated domain